MTDYRLLTIDYRLPTTHSQVELGVTKKTKKDIVRIISEQLNQTQILTKAFVQKTFDAITQTLVESGRIELRNFGVFEVKRRAARTARNPRTGQEVKVDEKFVVTFKPGKEMEQLVQEKTKKNRKKRKATSS